MGLPRRPLREHYAPCGGGTACALLGDLQGSPGHPQGPSPPGLPQGPPGESPRGRPGDPPGDTPGDMSLGGSGGQIWGSYREDLNHTARSQQFYLLVF